MRFIISTHQFPITANDNGPVINPVSYTHLDVYKRQVQQHEESRHANINQEEKKIVFLINEEKRVVKSGQQQKIQPHTPG